MRSHFSRKTICGAIKGDIDLTDEIKNIVLTGKIYHPSKTLDRCENRNIYNQVNFIINNKLTSCELIETYARYKQVELIPFEDYLEDKYSQTQYDLDNEVSNLNLQFDDFLEIITDLATLKHDTPEEMNFVFDAKEGKISYYGDDEWISMYSERGIKIIIEKMQDCYLDYYECFLINKIMKQDECQDRQSLFELIDVYFMFICAFIIYIKPYCYGRSDYKIMKHIDDERCTNVSDMFMARYNKIKQQVKPVEKRRIMKKLIDMIKVQSDSVIRTLKNDFSYLFQHNPTFKEFMTKELSI
jgi:hypothetical protein